MADPTDDVPAEGILGPRGATVRPVSAIVIGALVTIAVLALTVPSLFSDRRDLLVIALGLLVIVGVWAFVVRPSVRLDRDGVTIINPLRTSYVSWPAIEQVRSRWVLELTAEGTRHAAWGVPADPARPRYGRELFRMGVNKGADAAGPGSADSAGKVSAQTVAAEVEQRRSADRKRKDGRTPRIAVRGWDPLPVGLLVAAVTFVVVAWVVG